MRRMEKKGALPEAGIQFVYAIVPFGGAVEECRL